MIVAELAANAATHGRVPGRDFELRLALALGTLRIEVSDTRTERRPPAPGDVPPPRSLAESGRGLLLVEALADRWAVLDRVPIGKTVRAEFDLPQPPQEDAAFLGSLDSPQRRAAREVVAAAIEAHAPVIVLAHSLGSVVTCEALHARPDLTIDLLVTIGSPLALPKAVYERLDLGGRQRHGCPPGVSRWVNLSDPGNLVALPRGGIPRSFTGVNGPGGEHRLARLPAGWTRR